MAYVENGMVKEKRPVWRLSYLFRLFWSILNLIGIFITTMLSMDATQQYKKKFGSRGGSWDGGSGGSGSSGGHGPPRPPRGLDSVQEIDQSSTPTRDSCCVTYQRIESL
ncbi:hypothetical protein SUGI_1026410 [Cryptomeria japonica]|uniref:uncharacterized protein LOC131040858 isoform X2 n=1 Tax=Cryptomeria japonica TaxID=3369 RepID=UPI002414A8DE|nr:uncharacterized protein LOC131040858 isoform X2 [Cryptomeria japonica]GLJ48650.1 hypothetical protein SUGI_1026410 [Cryptomeria japonica]